MSKEYILVDGYNVVHYSKELSALAAEDLSHARERLQDVVSNYIAMKNNCAAVIVFDSQTTESDEVETAINKTTSVVYTKQGETADSYIEKRSYALSQRGELVFVVTSDRHEQMQILGAGAYRISAREFWLDITDTEKNYREDIKRKEVYDRNEVEERLSADVLRKLEKIRRADNKKY